MSATEGLLDPTVCNPGENIAAHATDLICRGSVRQSRASYGAGVA